MDSSPHTPQHSRNCSVEAVVSYPISPEARRQSTQGPTTPYRNSFQRDDTLDLSLLNSGGGAGGGMGNLADELADAFSDSGDEVSGDENLSEDDRTPEKFHGEERPTEENGRRDGGSPSPKEGGLNLPIRNYRRKESGAYDGSEYGSDSDLDSAALPSSLVVRIDAIESLARRGTENYGGPADDVVKRVIDGLRDLGSQSSLESSASRLITAHSALTTHLTHQTRQLHNLTFPLLSPTAPAYDEEAIDELIPLLLSLSDSMPRPSTAAFDSLSTLHSITSDLVQTLSYLSDTLHMSRQTTVIATRRLKSAKELVAEVRRDDELREEGERWLSRENWGERLKNRECAGVCREVIGGFEDVCNGWRERLLAQAEAQA